MNLQIITGYAKDLGAKAAGGIITARPASYPQLIDGELLSPNPQTAEIDAETGHYSLSVVKGAYVLIHAKDDHGGVFLNQNITISADDSLDLAVYLSETPPAVPAQVLILSGGAP